MLMMMMEQQHGQQKRRQEKEEEEEEEEEKQKEIEEEEEEDEEEEMMLPGFRFHPTDEELVSFYLRRKVQHKPISIELIKQLDIYKYDPWDLPKMASIGEKEWYFYCPRDRKYRNSARPNRVTSAGFWKATGTDRPIYASSGNSSSKPRCIGLKKSLVFYTGRAAKGLKTDWMMHEFRLPPPPLPPPSSNSGLKNHLSPAESWAICRIFRKNTASHHHHQRPLSLAPAPSLSWAEIESSRTEQEQASTSSNLSSQSQSQSQGSDAMAVGMGMNMSMNMNMGMGMGMGFFYSHHTQSNPSIISSCSEASDSFNCAAPSSEQQHVQVQVQDAFAAAMPMPMTFPCHLFDVFRGSIANAASPWDSPSLDVSATNASSA